MQEEDELHSEVGNRTKTEYQIKFVFIKDQM